MCGITYHMIGYCFAMLFRLTAVSDGTCVAATNSDGRQTRLFLVEKVAMALLIY